MTSADRTREFWNTRELLTLTTHRLKLPLPIEA
jgi:hypothetical protein